MDRLTISLADRSSDLLLRLMAVFNMLFLLAFLAMLGFSVSNARSEEACAGEDMIAEYEASDPALIARVREQASQVRNGEGLLWRVQRAGVEDSFLFGTMHLTDPRVIALPSAAQQAFDGARTVVIETTDILDQAKVAAAFAERPDLSMFTDGASLETVIPPAELPAVREALSRRGIPFGSVRLMKPWMLSAIAAMPACELNRKEKGAPVLDQKLAQDAQAEGKVVGGLESIIDQLGAMASLPMKLHVEGLVETLKLGDRIDDVMETMLVLYTRGETGMIWPFFRLVLPSSETGRQGYAAFEQTMVIARNHVMAERARAFLDQGSAFIAVGALHLPGESGLIELLRKDGFTVTPHS